MWIIGVIVVLVFLWVGLTYNQLVTRRNRVKNGFSQIDVLLKQRFDMIPNLVEVVKGYSAYEQETFEKLVNARNQYHTAHSTVEKANSNQVFAQTLGTIFALSESYPNLKANNNFLDLQKQLKEMEDKIRFSRQFFNDTVQLYNDKIMTFPNNILAGWFKFEKESYFEANSNERNSVNIHL